MKRLVSILVILAMVVMTSSMVTVSHDAPLGGQMDVAHAHVAVPSIADILADCCSTTDGKAHHSMSSCAMHCGTAVQWVTVAFYATDAELSLPVLHRRDFGLSSTQFRPPIAA
ncbi:MAG: hypothetical protein HEP70_18935 [Rhodobiaceae bacterium]|jgi:hypothetical protein|nr:hypothetical protein [Rhodobiaceae bacterium]